MRTHSRSPGFQARRRLRGDAPGHPATTQLRVRGGLQSQPPGASSPATAVPLHLRAILFFHGRGKSTPRSHNFSSEGFCGSDFCGFLLRVMLTRKPRGDRAPASTAPLRAQLARSLQDRRLLAKKKKRRKSRDGPQGIKNDCIYTCF